MNIDLVSIKELNGMKFSIPTYQRGYRWTSIEVGDLLDDIDEFISQEDGRIYCLQPLVVRMAGDKDLLDRIHKAGSMAEVRTLLNSGSEWEVIDGQQRLTTVYILLRYLLGNQSEYYEITYETRPGSHEFLKDINPGKADENIDYCHINNARKTIETWFSGKTDEEKQAFTTTLLEKVKFIWYETDEDNPINVFTRLNIGKISLTNAELIKALVMNSSNFDKGDEYAVRLRQQEIALQWETIENTLENDEFWLFLHGVDEKNDTRIDWIFDLICDNDRLGISVTDEEIGEKGRERYRTFRYFNHAFKELDRQEAILKVWNEVMAMFNTMGEWYGDTELYHYIGFLAEVEQGLNVNKLLTEWNKAESRDSFLNGYILPQISTKIKQCLHPEKKLDTQYEVSGWAKTRCKPVLLLFNIQSIIDENKTYKACERYRRNVFHKFPFHIYKLEKWDIEHIDSCTQNSLDGKNDKREFLLCTLPDVTDNDLRREITDYLLSEKDTDDEQDYVFDHLYGIITKEERAGTNLLADEEKDRIWNFALLDQGTNRSYKNALFASKRRTIIDKSQSTHTCMWSKDKLEKEKEKGRTVLTERETGYGGEMQCEVTLGGVPAFVPECTLKCFLKYYNRSSSSLREWNKDDATAYKNEIERTLGKFLNY